MSMSRLAQRYPYLITALVIFSIATGSLTGLLIATFHDLPAIRSLRDYKPDVVTTIRGENGEEIARLFRQKRFWTPYKQLPKTLREGLIATEDAEFLRHKGIRFLSILRALLVDIRKGKIVQGGSTITQQLAKQLFLTSEKSLIRKIKEAMLAIQIEKSYTKEDILELYCNQIYLGSGAYGFEAAANVYFGKSIQDVTLAESALLAGLPKAPSRYSPLRHRELAIRRRATVLSRMREEGYITRSEEMAARNEEVTLHTPEERKTLAPYLVEEVRRYLEKQYGADLLYREGLEVETTINPTLQRYAEEAITHGVANLTKRITRKNLYPQGVEAQGALVALRPEDGAIVALVGGTDFATSQFNRAFNARRQPGSAFKPIIYLSAIEAGFTPADILVDSPASYDDGSRPGPWKPVNFSHRFYGPVTLRRSLELSLNVASVKLLDKIGVSSAIHTARNLGVQSPLTPYLSLALGASAITPLELTAAYGAIANRGVYAQPWFIRQVRTASGDVLEHHDLILSDAVKPESAYLITSMLEGVVQNGTGKIAASLQRPVAAKTGTTSDYRDAWFVGYTPNLVTGVWVGVDDNRPMGRGETGSRAAGPIWVDFMGKALASTEVANFRRPQDIIKKRIDSGSGLLATPECNDTYVENFIAGTEPTTWCRREKGTEYDY